MSNLLAAGITGLVTGSVACAAVLLIALPSSNEQHGPKTLTSTGSELPTDLAAAVQQIDANQALLRDTFEMRQTGLEQRLDEVVGMLNRREVVPSAVASEMERAGPDTAAAAAPVPGDPQFEQAVAAAITRIEEREAAERDAEREQREADRMEERIAELTQSLGLNAYQQTEMRTLMIDNNAKTEEMRDKMRSGEIDRTEIRDSFEAIRTEMDESLAGFLTPAQYDQYKEENNNRWGGFGGGGGRGNRDTGGGPGGGAPGGSF
ncbi:hypothetical protein Pla163_32770 [Planctomycetes bacterium Pla163]|uniref:LTXXQ motif protein n=1 Tax=Rohdeia mirabilis TaxID=2528008 RepID=A0A518D3T7_9BACT|nr:hypothetical protein Pla163_32770 [Planctomycetes bacterium Pla163]